MSIQTIRDLLNQQYGVVIAPRFQRDADIIGTVVQLVLRQDPSRIAFIIVNTGTFDVGIIPVGQPTGQKSFIVAANGGTLSGTWRDDGELINREWRGFANGGASSCLILETVIEHPLPAKAP
ncbi:MAG TPA: hypothetical protein VKD46_00980 [bacterium]|nr:hypothetical protein [bacterium]